uniref:ABC transmembrane type-1 domain-containing protein n=1 Tax=Mesocestoides corti TaxID=53468 RepID=A0A5K3FWZ4_MESCO
MILETVGNLLTLSVSIAFVEMRDVLAAGFAGLVISFARNVTQGLSWFVRVSTEFETNIVSVERIKEYSELPTEAPWEVDEKKPLPQWPEGSLEFVNYSTRYREDLDLVLKSISFKINPGEKVSTVVGHVCHCFGLFPHCFPSCLPLYGVNFMNNALCIFQITTHAWRMCQTTTHQAVI